MSQAFKQIVEEINNSFTRGDTEGFLAHCTDDVVWTMEGDTRSEGKSAIREWLSQMGENAPPPQFTVDRMIAEGDTVACYGSMSMNEPKESAGDYSFCDIYTFTDGKVSELRAFVVKRQEEDNKNKKAAA